MNEEISLFLQTAAVDIILIYTLGLQVPLTSCRNS